MMNYMEIKDMILIPFIILYISQNKYKYKKYEEKTVTKSRK